MPRAQLGSLSGQLTPDPPALAVLAHWGTGCAHRPAAAIHPAQSWCPQGPRCLRAHSSWVLRPVVLRPPPRPLLDHSGLRPSLSRGLTAGSRRPALVAPLPSVCQPLTPWSPLLGPAGVNGEICSLVWRPSHRPRPAGPSPSAGESSECGPDGRDSNVGAPSARRRSVGEGKGRGLGGPRRGGRGRAATRAAFEALWGPAEKCSGACLVLSWK